MIKNYCINDGITINNVLNVFINQMVGIVRENVYGLELMKI
jgi:hypothetical protein